MALRNNPDATSTTNAAVADKPASTHPAFEDMDDGGTTVAQETVAESKTTPSTQTAVQTVKKSDVVAIRPMLDKNTMMRGLQNAIPTEELATMGIGVFPRITASLEGFMVDKNKRNLGNKIRVEVLSWNYITMVTTGEQNNPEANKLIQTSYDGKMLKNGTSVEEYVKWLKGEGYNKAEAKQYSELYVNLLGFMQLQGDTFVKMEVPAEEQAIYQVSLAPQSLGQWGRYMLEGSLRKARGISDDSVVTLVKESKTVGPNTFALATFTPRW